MAATVPKVIRTEKAKAAIWRVVVVMAGSWVSGVSGSGFVIR
jgi:hypothetical protein